ncbi:MAG: hypothetical protein COB24_07570 [Hyphomicrobiales bacterium]|nr:MAG: hypothetical protein COB24_07570 [Hyphomicrobiales bacterium]
MPENNNYKIERMSYKTLQQFNNNSKTALFMRLSISFGLMAIITFSALYYFNFLNNNQPQVVNKATTEQAATVDTLVIDFEDIQPTITNYGQVVAGKQLPLSADVSGRIKYLSPNFKNGAIVQKNELLMELESFQYEGNLITAKANLQDISFSAIDIDNQITSTEIAYKSTLSLYESAENDYQGSVKLQKSGIITKQALDEKNQTLIGKKQSLDTLSASLINLKNQKLQLLTTTDAQQWALDKASKDLASTKIYAPFNAYIHNSDLEIGQYISSNSTIATLLDQQKIDVKFSLSDGQYGRIIAQNGTIIGRKIQAIWHVGQVKKTFEAVINRVNSEIIAASGGIDLYASIENLETVEALRIGAFVKVLIPDQTYEQIIKIPEYMIYDNDLVYVVARSNSATIDYDTQAEPDIQDGSETNKAVKKAERNANIEKPENADSASAKNVPADQLTNQAKTDTVENQEQGQRQGKRKAQNNPEDSSQEVTQDEKRLESVQVKIVGYDGEQVLIINLQDSENALEIGDALLQTRLSLAGNGVLVITSEESKQRQALALAKIEADGAGNNSNRRGQRGPRGGQAMFGGSGGGNGGPPGGR